MLKSKKERLILVLIVASLFIVSLTVWAKQNEELIKVIYSDIKIQIDGVEYEPKDANGYPVEPFIYNGTTYLPVRGIANAFGSEVHWSPETSTISLGKSKFEWLDQMGYVDYYTDTKNRTVVTNALYSDDTYQHGIKLTFSTYGSDYEQGSLVKQKMTYRISKKYDKFYATIFWKNELNTADTSIPVTIKIYGDNSQVLYTSPGIDSDTKPVNITVNITGNEYIYIESSVFNPSWFGKGTAILGNARFLLAE